MRNPKPLATVTAGALAVVIAVSTGPALATASSLDDVHRAKIALVDFLADHVDRPLRIADPCPSLSASSATAHLTALGLTPSVRDYGAAIVFDGDVGGGLVALRCGVDIARSADPPGSVALSTDVTMLDGQATFDQYAVDLGGTDVVVTPLADPGGELVSRCSNGGRDCTAAFDAGGLVVTVRLRGLPADTGDHLARRLVGDVTPEIIADLAAAADLDK